MKWPSPQSVSQMSGFKNSESYFVGRQAANPEDFLQIEPSAAPLFDVFPFLRDPDLKRFISEQSGKDSLECRAYEVLKYLEIVFMQDAVFLHDSFSNCHIFQTYIFQDNWSMFLKWKQYVHSMSETLNETQHFANGDMKDLSNELKSMKRQIQQISVCNERRDGKLDRLLMMVGKQCSESGHQQKRIKLSNKASKSDCLLKSLPALNGIKFLHLKRLSCFAEMSLDDLWRQWKDPFTIDNKEWPCLKTLESERRAKKRPIYYEGQLETTIRRRRQIAEYIELTSLPHVKSIQSTLGDSKKQSCTLYSLWCYIRKETQNSA